MSRGILGIVAVLGVFSVMARSADAQVYAYGAPAGVYVPGAYAPAPVVVRASPLVTTAYYAPTPVYAAPVYAAPVYAQAYVAPSPVVQMAYTAPAPVYTAPVVAAPIVVGPTAVRQVTRGNLNNYTQITRTYGPDGPHYNRVHIHRGLFGTTVVERGW